MIGRIIGGVLLGAFAAAVIYEIVDRTNPELIQKVKNWFETEDDFFESEEATVE